LPVPAAGPPAARQRRGIAAKVDAVAAWQHDKSRKYPQIFIIFVVRRDGPAFDHEGGSDRKTLRQTANFVT
jgi:hypothetical protein